MQKSNGPQFPVGSKFYYKQLAQEVIAGIEGVDQLVNEIEVVW